MLICTAFTENRNGEEKSPRPHSLTSRSRRGRSRIRAASPPHASQTDSSYWGAGRAGNRRRRRAHTADTPRNSPETEKGRTSLHNTRRHGAFTLCYTLYRSSADLPNLGRSSLPLTVHCASRSIFPFILKKVQVIVSLIICSIDGFYCIPEKQSLKRA